MGAAAALSAHFAQLEKLEVVEVLPDSRSLPRPLVCPPQVDPAKADAARADAAKADAARARGPEAGVFRALGAKKAPAIIDLE